MLEVNYWVGVLPNNDASKAYHLVVPVSYLGILVVTSSEFLTVLLEMSELDLQFNLQVQLDPRINTSIIKWKRLWNVGLMFVSLGLVEKVN